MYYNPVNCTINGIPMEIAKRFRTELDLPSIPVYYDGEYVGEYYSYFRELSVWIDNETESEYIQTIAKEAMRFLPLETELVVNYNYN